MIASGLADLIQAAQAGDKEACGQLVEDNAGLIWSVVRRYTHRGVDSEDLYQLGCLGFLKAVQGFDTSYGTQFSTYAVPKIAGEIRRFLRDDGIVKVGRGMKEQALVIYRARNQLTEQLGREPVLSELARIKSNDMRDNRYFAHESPTYGNASAMLKTFGYAFNAVGENIAHHANVEKAQAAFMSSDGHRRNILSSSWTKVGIGVSVDAQGYVYVTQLFVR